MTNSDRQNAGRSPTWEVPFPYGFPQAVESMGLISAPFLAGVSIALAVFVISRQNSLYWADLAVLLLIGTALVLLVSVQCTFLARQFVVTPSQLRDWWEDTSDPDRLYMLRREQRRHSRLHKRWSGWARWAYNAGVLLLLLALAVILVPEGGIGEASGMRLAAIGLALLGLVFEALWICGVLPRGDKFKPTDEPGAEFNLA